MVVIKCASGCQCVPEDGGHLEQCEALRPLTPVDTRRRTWPPPASPLMPAACARPSTVQLRTLSGKYSFISNRSCTMRHEHLIFGELDKNYISQIVAQRFLKHLSFFEENRMLFDGLVGPGEEGQLFCVLLAERGEVHSPPW